jgi:hypothetical protein
LSGTIASDYYRASDYITASGEIDSPVRFQAAESITLLPGFQAASGTTFRAVIAPCTLSIPFIQPPVLEIQTRELEVKVFPNPLRRQSQVQIHALQAGSLHISLKDQMGRTIQQLADQTHYDDTYWEGTIESMDLPAGMYFLQVINGQQRVIQKLVRM